MWDLHASRGDLPGHSQHSTSYFSVRPVLKRKEGERVFKKYRKSLGLIEKEVESLSVKLVEENLPAEETEEDAEPCS